MRRASEGRNGGAEIFTVISCLTEAESQVEESQEKSSKSRAHHTHVITDDRVQLDVQPTQTLPETVSFLGRALHFFLDALDQARPPTTFDVES